MLLFTPAWRLAASLSAFIMLGWLLVAYVGYSGTQESISFAGFFLAVALMLRLLGWPDSKPKVASAETRATRHAKVTPAPGPAAAEEPATSAPR